MIAIFPAKKVISLRKRAQAAVRIGETEMDGWMKSPGDPMKLLNVFKSLNIKDGFTLRGYLFRAGDNGNGIIWAMPASSDFQMPDECGSLEDQFLSPPKPKEAVDDFRTVIEGDGTPLSYLSASLFAKEASEFGALWHGCDWTAHMILGHDPWGKGSEGRLPLIESDPADWLWQAEKPEIWTPYVREDGEFIEVHLITYSGLEQQALYHHIDRYRTGSFVFEEFRTTIAYGPGGYIY